MAATVPTKDLHRVVVTCIIRKRDRVLIRKRNASGPFPNRWEVPGGGLEPEDYVNLPQNSPDGWENVLEDVVVRREVRQETGLEIGQPMYLGNSIFVRETDGIPVVVLRFWAYYASGAVVLDDSATEWKWIAAEEAGSYQLIGSIARDIQRVVVSHM